MAEVRMADLFGRLRRWRAMRLDRVYRSRIVDSEILVLGVGGQFVPLKGIDDEILRLGRMAF